MRLTNVAAIACLGLASTAAAAACLPGQHLPGPGDFPVGFRHLVTFDLARPPLAEQQGWARARRLGRYLHVAVWYPARAAPGGARMAFADYLLTRRNELVAGQDIDPVEILEPQPIVDAAYRSFERDAAGRPAILSLVERTPMPMRGILDAEPARGHFPVLLIVHDAPDQFAFLAEHLASRGIVVASVSATGTRSKQLDWETFEGLESEARDLEVALAEIKQMYPAMLINLFVAGHSYGAQSAAAFAIRHRETRGLVSLDGGIGSHFGGALLARLPDYHPRRISFPILHVWTAHEGGFEFHWLESYRYAERYLIDESDLAHADFLSLGILSRASGESDGDGSCAERFAVYGRLFAYVRDFVHAFAQDALGTDFAEAWQRAPNVRYLAARPQPTDFRELLARADAGEFAVIVATLETESPDEAPAYTVNEMDSLWDRAFAAGALSAALQIAQRFRAQYPRSGQAAYRVARTLLEQGDPRAAEQTFAQALVALESDPYIDELTRARYLEAARQRLSDLTSAP